MSLLLYVLAVVAFCLAALVAFGVFAGVSVLGLIAVGLAAFAAAHPAS